MFQLFDHLERLLQNLNRARVRTALSASGVVIGTAAVVILITLATSVQSFTTQNLSSIGPLNEVSVISLSGGGGGGGGGGVKIFRVSVEGSDSGPSDQPKLTPHYLAEIAAREDVKAVMPRARLDTQALKYKQYASKSNNVYGVQSTALAAFEIPLTTGSLEPGRWQVVVGAKVGESFYDPREPRSSTIDKVDLQDKVIVIQLSKTDSEGHQTTRTVRLTVVGVMAPRGGDSDYAIYMPMTDFEELNAWQNGGTRPNWRKDGYGEAVVLAKEAQDVGALTKLIQDDGFIAFSSQQILDEINKTFGILQAFVGGIGLITLTIAGTGIANTLITAIYERTNEIGLMKAVGATDGQVMGVFLAEAGAIGGLGGVGGLLVGLIVAIGLNVIAKQYFAQQLAAQGGNAPSSIIVTPLWLFIVAPVFATLMGVLAGIYPARRAAALDPVVALRSE
jgi:putative ABC transport system permease protein